MYCSAFIAEFSGPVKHVKGYSEKYIYSFIYICNKLDSNNYH